MNPTPPKPGRLKNKFQRFFWLVLIGALLAWGWRGWFDPNLMLSWETFLAFCGLR